MGIKELALAAMFMDKRANYKAIIDELDERFKIESSDGLETGFKGAYCISDKVAIAKVVLGDGRNFPVIMDNDIYVNHIANGKANVRVESRDDGQARIVIEGHERDASGVAPRPWLWHLVTNRSAGSDLITDHVRNTTLINLRSDLRLCTVAENSKNSSRIKWKKYKEFNPDADEFTYSLARDCSHTLYAYVRMLLGDITEDELAEVNKIVNARRLMPEDSEERKKYLENCEKVGIYIQ